MKIRVEDILKLSVRERLRLMEAIRQSLGPMPDSFPLSSAQIRELDRRVAAHARNPSAAKPWAKVKARLRRRS